jgi:hypothetical protein
MAPPHDGSSSRATTRVRPTIMPLRPGPAGPRPASEQHDNEQPATDQYENTPGHPLARGTLPMARYLTDPGIEHEIQVLAAEADPMSPDQQTKLARLLRLNGYVEGSRYC